MTDDVTTPDKCLNCGEQVSWNYCPNCGQEHTTMILPVGHLLHDVVDEFVLLDSKVLQTLKMLVTRPGFLTEEYIAGRRARYVSPFRLYFVISAVYFLAFSFAHYDVAVMHGFALALEQAHHAHVASADSTPAKSQMTSEQVTMHSALMHSALMHPANGVSAIYHNDTMLPENSAHAAHHDARPPPQLNRAERHRLAVNHTTNWFLKNQSLMTFLLVPIAALLLKLLYFTTGKLYMEHLVFAVHIQAFLFALLLPALLPIGRNITYLLALLASAVYLFMAMRAVYRQSISVTFAKCGLMLASYLLLMAAAAFSAFLIFY